MTLRAALVVPIVVLLSLVNDIVATDENPLHLQGHKKKRTSDGKVFASYGLSPLAASPKRTVQYSKEAVYAASSSASSHSSNRSAVHHDSHQGQQQQQPRAPGCPHAKIDLRPYMSAVEDQSQSNSCAANAVAGAYEYLATRAALRDDEETVGEISRLFIYYVGRKRDQVNWGSTENGAHLQPTDGGMSLQGAIEAVQLKGAALQRSWPFDLNRVNQKPSPEAFEEAVRFKVGDAMRIPLDLDAIRQCLSDGYPIIFGLKLTLAFFNPPSDGFIPTPDPSDPQAAEHGLHAMLLVGYNDRQRVFIVRNSWGSGWGVDGYGFLSYDYVVNENFNFVGMFAIQSLTDDDLTPDEDDFQDMAISENKESGGPLDNFIEDFFEELMGAEEEEDWEDMFDSRGETLRAFTKFAGNHGELASHNLLLDKQELKSALKVMGVPMVSDEEIDLAFARYDDDRSGFLSFDEFVDMQEFFDGSLLERKNRLFHQIEGSICHNAKKSLARWLPQYPDGANQLASLACGLTKTAMSSWAIPSNLEWASAFLSSVLFPQTESAGEGPPKQEL